MEHAHRCPHCEARVASFETECPRCGGALRLQIDDDAGAGGSPATGRADRTAFGIHVMDVGAPAPDGGVARQPELSPERASTSTIVGRRAPGFGIDTSGTAVGVRSPMTPRDADSTSLNALGSANLRAVEVATQIIRPPDASTTMLGVSLEQDEPPPAAPAARQIADDWLDDISDYLRDHADDVEARLEQARVDAAEDGTPAPPGAPSATPAPAEDHAPAFGIIKRAKNVAAPAAQLARIRTQTVRADGETGLPAEPLQREEPELRDEPSLEAPVDLPPSIRAPESAATSGAPDAPSTDELRLDDPRLGPNRAASPPSEPDASAPQPRATVEQPRPLESPARPPDDAVAPPTSSAPFTLEEMFGGADLAQAPIGAALEPSSMHPGVDAGDADGAPETFETAPASDFLSAAARVSGAASGAPRRGTVPMRPLAPPARPSDRTGAVLTVAIGAVGLGLVGFVVWMMLRSAAPLPSPSTPSVAPPGSENAPAAAEPLADEPATAE